MKGSDFYYRVTSFYLISLATISRTMSDRTLMADKRVTVSDVQENTTNFSSLNCNSAGQQVRQCGDTRAKRRTPLRGEGAGAELQLRAARPPADSPRPGRIYRNYQVFRPAVPLQHLYYRNIYSDVRCGLCKAINDNFVWKSKNLKKLT